MKGVLMGKMKFKKCIYVLILLALASCASEPKVTELSPSSDPQAEISRIDENLKQAKDRQVDMLSPRNFEKAEKARSEAIEFRSKNKSQEKILHQIALSEAYLDQANKIAKVGEQIIHEPLVARKAALNARAQTNFNHEMNQADSELRDLAKKIENNDTNITEKKKNEIVVQYRELEMNSIKKDKLGLARANLEQAIKEGARKLTPETLDAAEKQVSTEDANISAHRSDKEEINRASTRATVATERLLKMVRLAKTSASSKPEELAKQVEASEREALQSERMMSQAERELLRTRDRLTNQAELTKNLESKARLDQEFEAARKEFNDKEAEVYRQGNNLIIRLKGLAFANNKSDIPEKNFALLAKVKKVIGDVDASKVTIEGHTDSIGAKEVNTALSEKRAKAVQSYLLAEEGIDAAKITTEGFGDAKPIATNKTADGRAQNRRVDVIISAEPITE